MKKFKIIGPITERELEIQDDEMLEWKIIKIKDYEKREGIGRGSVEAPRPTSPQITSGKKRPQPSEDGVYA